MKIRFFDLIDWGNLVIITLFILTFANNMSKVKKSLSALFLFSF